MTKKVYYLKTCDTSRRILKDVSEYLEGFEFHEIKEQPVSVVQLDEMKALAGSYEALFSRRAKKYREMGLKDQNLSEADYKYYLLHDYTFLKRPVFIIGDDIFTGNSKKNLVALKKTLQNL